MPVKDEFIIERQGKRMVLFGGLLEEFHDKADREEYEGVAKVIETKLLQVPSSDNTNTAICHASVGFKRNGDWVLGPFQGIGDASPANVGRNIAPHIIRMAETRAKARALRDLVNVGDLDLDGDPSEDQAPVQSDEQKTPRAERKVKPPQPDEVPGVSRGVPADVELGQPALTSRKAYLKHVISKSDWESVEGWEEAHKPVDELTSAECQKAITSLE